MAALFEAILALKTPEECHAFFKDLCTYQELNAISQRLQVAKLLRPSAVSIVSLKMDATGTS